MIRWLIVVIAVNMSIVTLYVKRILYIIFRVIMLRVVVSIRTIRRV